MSKLVLTADQIFALAYKLDAKYLDYYYISLSNRDDRNNLWLILIPRLKRKELMNTWNY